MLVDGKCKKRIKIMNKNTSTRMNWLLAPIKYIWRLTPAEFRAKVTRARLVLRNDFPLITHPTYADDGLISQHVTDFLSDPKFSSAYALGERTGALEHHPGGIEFRAYIACWAAKHASALEGDFVECGVGRGLLSRTIAHYLDFEHSPKKFYLFDTFEGIPVDEANDDLERQNMVFLNRLHFDNDYYETVRSTFEKYKNIILVKGRVPASFDTIALERVSYISIDMNNATAEIAAIEYLWDKLVFGGVIILGRFKHEVQL